MSYDIKGGTIMARRIRVKPGKGESMAGFLGGLVFIGIGIFIAIPNFGIFGVFWTLIAVVITGVNGYNVFSDKGVASWEANIDEDIIETHREKESLDFDEKIRKLHKLREEGLISEEDFQIKKKEILNEKW